jgi:ubiquinone/menaquinone biosynthesis C-methylase UbiE
MLQASLYEPLTRTLLLEAGLAEGMRVLDLGCGPGDTTLLAAGVVGHSGTVLGIDLSPEQIQLAEQRAGAAGARQARFAVADLHNLALDEPFDFVFGRFVLTHQADPVGSIAAAAGAARPDGILAFQEKVLSTRFMCQPGSPLLAQAGEWMQAARHLAGMEEEMGYKLHQMYSRAGLPAPQLRYEAPIGAGADWPGYAFVAETLRGMLPVVHLLGIASPEAVDIDTFETRLREEIMNLGAVFTLPPCVGAWTRTPM